MGMMLVYSCQLVGLFQWGVRQSLLVENLMTSVERVLEYAELPNENDENDDDEEKNNDKRPPKEWPSRGEITFEDVSFRYDQKFASAF